MNETKVYADGYFQSFAGEGDFLSFLKSRKDKTTWKKEASNNLRFEALVKDTARTEAIAHDYRVMDIQYVDSSKVIVCKFHGNCRKPAILPQL